MTLPRSLGETRSHSQRPQKRLAPDGAPGGRLLGMVVHSPVSSQWADWPSLREVVLVVATAEPSAERADGAFPVRPPVSQESKRPAVTGSGHLAVGALLQT